MPSAANLQARYYLVTGNLAEPPADALMFLRAGGSRRFFVFTRTRAPGRYGLVAPFMRSAGTWGEPIGTGSPHWH